MTDLTCPSLVTYQGGLTLSRIVAGMWRMNEWKLTPQQRVEWIEQALAMGVTSFDHADIYGGGEAEKMFGARGGQVRNGDRAGCGGRMDDAWT